MTFPWRFSANVGYKFVNYAMNQKKKRKKNREIGEEKWKEELQSVTYEKETIFVLQCNKALSGDLFSTVIKT